MPTVIHQSKCAKQIKKSMNANHKKMVRSLCVHGVNAVADDSDGSKSDEDITSFKNVHTPIVEL